MKRVSAGQDALVGVSRAQVVEEDHLGNVGNTDDEAESAMEWAVTLGSTALRAPG